MRIFVINIIVYCFTILRRIVIMSEHDWPITDYAILFIGCNPF